LDLREKRIERTSGGGDGRDGGCHIAAGGSLRLHRGVVMGVGIGSVGVRPSPRHLISRRPHPAHRSAYSASQLFSRSRVSLLHDSGRRGLTIRAGVGTFTRITRIGFGSYGLARVSFAAEGGAADGTGMRAGLGVVNHTRVTGRGFAVRRRLAHAAGKTIFGDVLFHMARGNLATGAGMRAIRGKALAMFGALGVSGTGGNGQCNGDGNEGLLHDLSP